jgi:hypothetical protein
MKNIHIILSFFSLTSYFVFAQATKDVKFFHRKGGEIIHPDGSHFSD